MYLERCDDELSNSEDYRKLRKEVLKKMSSMDAEKFFELLFNFDESNRKYFMHHLHCTLGDPYDATNHMWLVFDEESESQYLNSLEMMDLLDGNLITYTEEPTKSDERIRWHLYPIR